MSACLSDLSDFETAIAADEIEELSQEINFETVIPLNARRRLCSSTLGCSLGYAVLTRPTKLDRSRYILDNCGSIPIALSSFHFRRGFRLAIIFSRHARRQMKWRRVSEADVVRVIDAPDRLELSRDERINAFKSLDGRLLKATYVEEEANIVVITVIEKESVEA